MNEIQDKIARRVLAHSNAVNDRFAIDPVTIVLVINVIINIIRLLWHCYGKNSIIHKMKSNSTLHNLLLSRAIRREFKDISKSDRKNLYNAFKNVNSELSEKEAIDLVNSILEEK